MRYRVQPCEYNLLGVSRSIKNLGIKIQGSIKNLGIKEYQGVQHEFTYEESGVGN